MKKLAYISFTLLFLGCANVSEEKSFATNDSAESEITKDEATINVEEAFPYATITGQKLQEYFDLVALKNQHPAFAETISEQLEQLTNDTILLPKGQDSVAVKNLSPVGSIRTINDTLQQQEFTYSIVSKTMFKTDTLTAFIVTKPVMVDGVEAVSTKVLFRNN